MIIPIVISLTSLGMKLPSIAGLSSGKPKPRPRAVLQAQVKKCKEQIESQSLDLAPTENRVVITPPPLFRLESKSAACRKSCQFLPADPRASPLRSVPA
jgi:hypothetical protein